MAIDRRFTVRRLPLAFMAFRSTVALCLWMAGAACAAASSSGTVDTPDGKIYYEVHGQGDPIVLVAGGPGESHTSLLPEFDELAKRHQVIFFDNIGRGHSSALRPGVAHSPDRDASDIERLRQALGFPKITVIGHSYGGYPALAYAARYPSRLRRLVISSSGHSGESWQRNIDNVNRFVENQYPEVWQKLQQLQRAGVHSCDAKYQDVLGEPIGQLYWHDPALEAHRVAVSKDPKDRARLDVYCAIIGPDSEMTAGGTMKDFDPRPRLRSVRVPTWITAGRYDPVCPPVVAYQIQAAFPKGMAKVRIFEKSAHRPWVEEHDAYFRELEAFLAPKEFR